MKLNNRHSLVDNANFINKLHTLLRQDICKVNDIIIKHITSSKEKLICDVTTYFFNSGGKRIRPILTILMSKLFNHCSDASYYLAAAVEFIHAATLLHDDVIDESTMRRSQLSAHLKWSNKTSILVGDFLFSQSFKLMIKSNSMQALKSLSTSFNTIIEGEVKQLTQLQTKRIINEDEYFQVIHAKTAELFGTACEVAAIAANQPEHICALVKNFGIKLGLIFQIIDDLLDYFGTPSSLGKNTGDDFTEGKVTLPVIIAYRATNSQQDKDFWHRVIIKREHKNNDFKYAVELLYKYNILELIHQRILLLENEVYEIISQINANVEYKEHLVKLTRYIINRAQ